ncbi:MAG: hypothetical protein ACOC3W_13085, partial [Thermodesulfobacteriota bacterium]
MPTTAIEDSISSLEMGIGRAMEIVKRCVFRFEGEDGFGADFSSWSIGRFVRKRRVFPDVKYPSSGSPTSVWWETGKAQPLIYP